MGNIETDKITVGVVGLGLMGSSLITSLLIAGHDVKAIAPISDDMAAAPERITNHLAHCDKAGLLTKPIAAYVSQLVISEDYNQLSTCRLVLECVIEVLEVKKSVYQKIEAVVSNDTVIATNTSAIPISELQKYLANAERFLGIHWAEPSYFTRFLEITKGDHTAEQYSEWVYELAHYWGKEPTLLRKDIRGFITNRLMYAVYREGLNIVANDEATFEDVDKAFRYDAGSWMTLMGIFRRMDFMGLKDAYETYKRLSPQFCNSKEIPDVMQKMLDIDAKGTRNAKGLYNYSEEEARQWDEAFAVFNMEIYQLATQYPWKKEKEMVNETEEVKQYASQV
ncbi:MAG: 3-hydroxyacyl-CoA dehydrogenase family protein [Bacteroidota bacterium]